MTFIITRTLITALIFVAGTATATQPQSDEDTISSELAELLPYLNNDKLDLPETVGQSSSCSVHLLVSALLYRRNPDKHRNDFFAALVVDDYADRAAGKYNYVNPDAIASTIDSSMAVPDGITDNRVKAVIGFCTLRDKNLWIDTQKAGRISLARAVRGMALSLLLVGTDEDSLAIANAIDAHTAANHSPPGQ
jgi:hypothetical protein